MELHSKLRTSCIMADKMSSTHKVFGRFEKNAGSNSDMQALANTSSHVAARLAGLLLESPDLSALDMVCLFRYPVGNTTNADYVYTYVYTFVFDYLDFSGSSNN